MSEPFYENINDHSVPAKFYTDGTYTFSNDDKNISKWKVEEGELYYKHPHSESWQHWPKTSTTGSIVNDVLKILSEIEDILVGDDNE